MTVRRVLSWRCRHHNNAQKVQCPVCTPPNRTAAAVGLGSLPLQSVLLPRNRGRPSAPADASSWAPIAAMCCPRDPGDAKSSRAVRCAGLGKPTVSSKAWSQQMLQRHVAMEEALQRQPSVPPQLRWGCLLALLATLATLPLRKPKSGNELFPDYHLEIGKRKATHFPFFVLIIENGKQKNEPFFTVSLMCLNMEIGK